MVRLFISALFIFFISQFDLSRAQTGNYLVKINFNEWMDTTGFKNPNNFIWTQGLVTLNVQLVDTSTAIVRVSQPQLYKWYTVTVSNVYDKAGNLINPGKDTTGIVWREIPVPVELSSFNAKVVQEKVELNWTTKTEVNNYGFDVERNANETGWQKIGFVAGSGNSNSPKSYSFTDNNANGGSRFKYRLKQIDTDGQYEHSEAVEVEIIPYDFTLFQNYPNPFNSETRIKFQLPVKSKVEIKVFDISGAEIITLVNDTREMGTYEVKFNSKDLTSGVYIYRFVAENPEANFIEIKKMILLR